jgi:hypothetical protein
MEDDRYPRLDQLPGSLAAGETSTNHVDRRAGNFVLG